MDRIARSFRGSTLGGRVRVRVRVRVSVRVRSKLQVRVRVSIFRVGVKPGYVGGIAGSVISTRLIMRSHAGLLIRH